MSFASNQVDDCGLSFERIHRQLQLELCDLCLSRQYAWNHSRRSTAPPNPRWSSVARADSRIRFLSQPHQRGRSHLDAAAVQRKDRLIAEPLRIGEIIATEYHRASESRWSLRRGGRCFLPVKCRTARLATTSQARQRVPRDRQTLGLPTRQNGCALFRDLIQFEPCQQLSDVGGIDPPLCGFGVRTANSRFARTVSHPKSR